MSAAVPAPITLNKEMAREFLTLLDPTAEKFTFQFISDTGKGGAETFHGSFDEAWRKVELVNNVRRQIGAFVTINETDGEGRRTKNITRVRAVYVDADGPGHVQRCEEALSAPGLTPSAVVRTGRGKHYYFLTELPLDEFSDFQRYLIERLGTDKSVNDLPRVMRLPGTLHLKDPNNPRLVSLEPRGGARRRYSTHELMRALGGSAAMQPILSPPSPTVRPATSTSFARSPSSAHELFAVRDEDTITRTTVCDPVVQGIFKNAIERLSDGLEANVEEIRSAMSAIPPSALASEHDWGRIARGLAREAAIFPASKAAIYTVLDDRSRLAPGYDAKENRRRWTRYKNEAFDRDVPITVATVFDVAKKHGWSGHVQLDPSPSCLMHTTSATRAVPISSLPQTAKKREWLCGTYLMRAAVSLLSAPGARGKTAWLIALAMSCASGKPLLGAHLFGDPKTVLFLSVEESTDEINLRFRAAMQHHGISEADLSGLYVIGAERWGLPLVGVNRGAPQEDEKGWAALVAELDRLRPDILICDPLINLLGGADANNNSVAALLMGRFAKEAATRNMAVMLAHHVPKGRDPTSAESAMGAISFVNLSRITLNIDTLQEDKAGIVGLPPWEAKFVFRVLGTKQNYSPVKSEDDWFRLADVEVQNAQPPTYPNGDRVGVVERFTPAASGAALFPEDLLRSALQAIQDADPPLTPSARSNTRYAVPVLAKAIAPHRGGRASEPEAKAVLGHLMDVGLAAVEERKIAREGGRSDMRKGLFPTASGTDLLRKDHNIVPQPPQSSATPYAGSTCNAGGAPPCGPPATQGGMGGNAGAHRRAQNPSATPSPRLHRAVGGAAVAHRQRRSRSS